MVAFIVGKFKNVSGDVQEFPKYLLKTKTAWKKRFCKVQPDAVPWIDLETRSQVYFEDQTTPFPPTPKQLAYHEFEQIFQFHSGDKEKWICEGRDGGRWTEYRQSGWHDAYHQDWPGTWNLPQHLSGKKKLGICKADTTQVVVFDIDNHDHEHDPLWHLERVETLVNEISTRYSRMKLVAEVNPENGSTHLLIIYPKAYKTKEIRGWLQDFRADLHEKYPHLSYDQLEIYPDNLPQVLLPLRPDKYTIIDRFLPKFEHYYMKDNRRVPIDIYSVEEFMAYLKDKSRILDLALLRSQIVQALEWDGSYQERPRRKPKAKKTSTGMTGISPYKNNFMNHIVDFVEGRIESDTIGKYTTPIERYLMVAEGVSSQETQAIISGVIDRHQDRNYSDRLSKNPKEFWRADGYTRKAISSSNGYQKDASRSTEKLLAVKECWDKKNLDVVNYLKTGDKSCIQGHFELPRIKLKWTADNLVLAQELSEVAVCSVEKAREILETIAGHVHHGGELAIEYLRGMVLRLGIRCGHHNKASDIRKWLEDVGWLVKIKSYWYDSKTGIGMGNFYISGLMVEEEVEGNAVYASIYLSIPLPNDEPEWITELRQEERRLTLDDAYKRRWKQVAVA